MGEFKKFGGGESPEPNEVEKVLETLRGHLGEIVRQANASRDQALRWLSRNEASISPETEGERLRILRQEAETLARAMDKDARLLIEVEHKLKEKAAVTEESSSALNGMARQVAETLELLEEADSRLRAEVLIRLDHLLA